MMKYMAKLKYHFLFVIACALTVACSSEPAGTGTAGTATPAPAATVAPLSPDEEVAVIETDYGKIRIRFYPDVAPRHVEHFKKLVRSGFYDGLAFHRVLPDRIIQGGDPTTRYGDRSRWGAGEPGQETVPAEFSTRPFVRGTVGAARKGNDINSATSQFFLCLRENPSWNGQYTVFGEVIQGLNTVQIISNLPSEGPPADKVLDKVVMHRVTLEKAGDAAADTAK